MAIHKDQLYLFGGRSNDCEKYAVAQCRARTHCVLIANSLCNILILFSPPSLGLFPLQPHSPCLATLTWCRLAVTCAATSGCTMCLGLTHVRRIAVAMASVSGGSVCATRVSRASAARYVAINSPLSPLT